MNENKNKNKKLNDMSDLKRSQPLLILTFFFVMVFECTMAGGEDLFRRREGFSGRVREQRYFMSEYE